MKFSLLPQAWWSLSLALLVTVVADLSSQTIAQAIGGGGVVKVPGPIGARVTGVLYGPDRTVAATVFGSLFLSTDGGVRFREVDIPFSVPRNGMRVEATSVMLDSTGSYWLGTEEGLWKSDDGMETWSFITERSIRGASSLVATPSAVFNHEGNLVRRTSDGGRTWDLFPLATGPRQSLFVRGDSVFYQTVDSILYVVTATGTDIDSILLAPIRPGHTVINPIVFDVGRRLIGVSEGDLFVSDDLGRTWDLLLEWGPNRIRPTWHSTDGTRLFGFTTDSIFEYDGTRLDRSRRPCTQPLRVETQLPMARTATGLFVPTADGLHRLDPEGDWYIAAGKPKAATVDLSGVVPRAIFRYTKEPLRTGEFCLTTIDGKTHRLEDLVGEDRYWSAMAARRDGIDSLVYLFTEDSLYHFYPASGTLSDPLPAPGPSIGDRWYTHAWYVDSTLYLTVFDRLRRVMLSRSSDDGRTWVSEPTDDVPGSIWYYGPGPASDTSADIYRIWVGGTLAAPIFNIDARDGPDQEWVNRAAILFSDGLPYEKPMFDRRAYIGAESVSFRIHDTIWIAAGPDRLDTVVYNDPSHELYALDVRSDGAIGMIDTKESFRPAGTGYRARFVVRPNGLNRWIQWEPESIQGEVVDHVKLDDVRASITHDGRRSYFLSRYGELWRIDSLPRLPLYRLDLDAGYGSGEFLAGERVEIRARSYGESEAFTGWIVVGDSAAEIAFGDEREWLTTITMPPHDLRLSAEFDSIPGFSINRQRIPVSGAGDIDSVSVIWTESENPTKGIILLLADRVRFGDWMFEGPDIRAFVRDAAARGFVVATTWTFDSVVYLSPSLNRENWDVADTSLKRRSIRTAVSYLRDRLGRKDVPIFPLGIGLPFNPRNSTGLAAAIADEFGSSAVAVAGPSFEFDDPTFLDRRSLFLYGDSVFVAQGIEEYFAQIPRAQRQSISLRSFSEASHYPEMYSRVPGIDTALSRVIAADVFAQTPNPPIGTLSQAVSRVQFDLAQRQDRVRTFTYLTEVQRYSVFDLLNVFVARVGFPSMLDEAILDHFESGGGPTGVEEDKQAEVLDLSISTDGGHK